MQMFSLSRCWLLALLLWSDSIVQAQQPLITYSEQSLEQYLQWRVKALEDKSRHELGDKTQWLAEREKHRSHLFDMLGLQPLPPKTELQATVTGTLEHDDFVVEKLHFQSRPGLYVTGNLYRPKKIEQPLPAVLYVCGHSLIKKGNVSYGNKVGYQHHGAWFARNGYVCLVIDSLQLGEIEGIHHGTYKYDMWWWVNRGYTPAGVEAWNCKRALDYLESRPDVNKTKLGVTGRSGGGAYSWWIAALDNRIQCAVPVAGITDLQNHVVQGVVEGHCDCMFMHNTYQWDYAQVAALVAPRPLLLSNTDTDNIFPLSGVSRIHEQTREVYQHFGAADKFGFNITPGGHKDTQELQMAAFRWMNYHLRGTEELISHPAEKFFEPEQLRVFTDKLPENQINTKIQETFVATAPPATVPNNAIDWESQCQQWQQQLIERTFHTWPEKIPEIDSFLADSQTSHDLQMQKYILRPQPGLKVECYVVHNPAHKQLKTTVLNVCDAPAYSKFLATYSQAFPQVLPQDAAIQAQPQTFEQDRKLMLQQPWAMAYVIPRGVGKSDFTKNAKHKIHVPRRLHLLGETLHGGQVFDTRCALQMLRNTIAKEGTLWLQSEGVMGGVALYAALFEKNIGRIELHGLPESHRSGPYLWNIDRVMSLPETVACVATRHPVVIYTEDAAKWHYPQQVATKLGWPKEQLQIRTSVEQK